MTYLAFPSFKNSDSNVIPKRHFLILRDTGLKFISRACLNKENRPTDYIHDFEYNNV